MERPRPRTNTRPLRADIVLTSPVAQVQGALEALTDKQILRDEAHEGGVRMRFEDPFLSQWIRAFPARFSGLPFFDSIDSAP
jgi:hypothetical protein